MDLINAVWLTRPGQVEQVMNGIAQSFWTDLNHVGIWAMLYLLFDQQRYLGNFLCKQIVHGFLEGITTEEVLASITTLLEHFSGHCWE